MKRPAARRQGKFKRVAWVRKGVKAKLIFDPMKQLSVSDLPNFPQVAGSERVYALIGNTTKDQKGTGLFIGSVSPISRAYSVTLTMPESPLQPSGKLKKH